VVVLCGALGELRPAMSWFSTSWLDPETFAGLSRETFVRPARGQLQRTGVFVGFLAWLNGQTNGHFRWPGGPASPARCAGCFGLRTCLRKKADQNCGVMSDDRSSPCRGAWQGVPLGLPAIEGCRAEDGPENRISARTAHSRKGR